MAKSKQKGGGGGPKPVVVEVQAAEPTVSGDTWEVLVTAIVSQGGQALFRGVQFYVDGQEEGSPIGTDPNGRVPCLVTKDNTVKHITVEAQVTGAPFRGRVVVAAPEKKEAKKPPGKLSVDVSGRGGNYILSISVMTADGAGIKEVTVYVLDAALPTGYEEKTTSSNGSVNHDLNFSESERWLTIKVAGTELVWKKRLFGPRQAKYHPHPTEGGQYA